MSKDDLQKNFKKSDLGEFNSECESFYVYRINIIADLRKTESPNPSICKNASYHCTLNAGEH